MPTFEHTVYLGRRYTAHFFVRDNQQIIENIRERIAKIIQTTGLSKTIVMQEVLEAGIQALENNKLVDSVWDKENKVLLKIQQKRDQIKLWSQICSSMGEKDFTQWAIESGYSEEEIADFLTNEYQYNLSDIDWLKQILGNGPIKTSDIRLLAEKEGIVKDEKDWGRLRQVAYRAGLTKSSYGQWSL